MTEQSKEKQFLDSLESLFTGIEIKGDSGFANLIRIKRQYFRSIHSFLIDKSNQCTESETSSSDGVFGNISKFFMQLELDRINQSAEDELFDHLSNFFSRHFNESGSIANAGERVYADNNDVSLPWETQMLYYVKSDSKPNVDFFINKDARGFLCEQFDLWLYKYMFKEETVFKQPRLNQLQLIRKIAYNIIDFIAKFEDELKRVWEKPKLVRDVNYVVTLDKLTDEVLKRLVKHKGAGKQVKEWQQLGLVDDKFSMKMIFKGQKSFEDKNSAGEDCKFLPIDTKHFKALELEILDALGNLDEALDGELVHSENWQALNTLKRRYKGKVKCIYIDPPFNLDSSGRLDYRTNYKDSCWAVLLENRIRVAKKFLADDGAIFVRCDYHGNWIVRCLLDKIFGETNFRNEVIIRRGYVPAGNFRRLPTANDFLFMYAKDTDFFNMVKNTRAIPEENRRWISLDMPGQRQAREKKVRVFFGEERFPPKGQHWGLSQEKINKLADLGDIKINLKRQYIDTEGQQVVGMPEYLKEPYVLLNTVWDDIPGYTTHNTFFATENSEELLRRVADLITITRENIVVDFFSGSGTTMAVSQKLGRKWLGVEMGAHFHTVILPRMKKVIGGHQSGISKQIEYRGGGAFKYYSLEQYEETLKNASYNDDKSALEINIHDLYSDIDIAESLSNILGKPIRHRTAESVTFADGAMEKINLEKMTEAEKQHFTSLMKPYFDLECFT